MGPDSALTRSSNLIEYHRSRILSVSSTAQHLGKLTLWEETRLNALVGLQDSCHRKKEACSGASLLASMTTRSNIQVPNCFLRYLVKPVCLDRTLRFRPTTPEVDQATTTRKASR